MLNIEFEVENSIRKMLFKLIYRLDGRHLKVDKWGSTVSTGSQ